jgi:heterotetrameric sarcosine oxidase gamma subunit
VDIRRFAPFHGNTSWLRDRVGEILGLHYAVPWPNREPVSARPLRRSPVHHLLGPAGACFGSKMGWERPNVFAPPPAEPVIEYTWDQPNWLPWSAAEQRAARRDVALFDETSFSKYLLTGPGSEQALQWLCTADVAVPPGTVVYTGMLNERGGYESDLTVTRLSADEFLLVSSSATTERDKAHISGRLAPGTAARLVDVTSGYAVFGVMGPKSRDLLASLSAADWTDQAFPVRTSQLVDLGYFTVRATRITYVGELGWELYVPTEFAAGVLELLTAAGPEFGLVNAGYYTIESMRLEKAYRAYGRELTPEYNPVEAGLLFACKLRGSVPFLGREAVEKARAEGVSRRLVSVVVDDPGGPAPMLWGGELVLRDGVPAGQLTSAAWGEALAAPVGLGYVRHPAGGVLTAEFARGGAYQVSVGGRVYPATVTTRPPFDPAGARIQPG